MTSYSDVSLMIDGAWTKGANGRTIPVINPATEEVIGQVAHAEKSDLDRALAAADNLLAALTGGTPPTPLNPEVLSA